MSSRLLAYMPVRNEADRYLDAVLTNAMPQLDGLAVYDDGSDDATPYIAARHGARVRRRPMWVAGFMENEGRFRQAAWEWMEECLRPTEDDWILALDADELLIVSGEWDDPARNALVLPIAEVFAVDTEAGQLVRPRVRVDGLWGTIAGLRMVRYRPDGRFAERPMGSDAVPTYATSWVAEWSETVQILHLGYASAVDATRKYQRYRSLNDNGHNLAHIESIFAPPRLVMWPGPWPEVWRKERR